MKLSDLKVLIIYFNPIKSFILICVTENRLDGTECTKHIFYFSKVLYFHTKKNTVQTCKEI